MIVIILILTISSIAKSYVEPQLMIQHSFPKQLEHSNNAVKANSQQIPQLHIPKVSPFIVGGTEVSPPHKYPFLAALFVGNFYFCGGTLISNLWILTAAHCTIDESSFQVRLGEHNLDSSEGTEVVLQSADIIIHENYSSATFHDDIALIRLPTQVTFTTAIQAIALPSPRYEDLGGGEDVTVIGWGGTISNVAYEVTVKTITNEECSTFYGSLPVAAGNLCTSSEGGQGASGGDDGCPVIYDTAGELQLRGVVSYGSSSATGHPNIHTRVTHYLDWIQAITGGV